MLTDARIRKIKSEAKTKRYADEKGMYLEVTPSGGMYWRLKYRIDGKENRYSIGVYGEVSLAEARTKRDEARKLIAQGVNPNQAKKEAKDIIDNVNSFEVWARKWLLDRQSTIKPDTFKRDSSLLEKDLIPFIGQIPIDKIKSPEILAAARKVEDRGAGKMARRMIRLAGCVFRQAMREGVATYDPTDGLTEALKPRKVVNMVRIDAKHNEKNKVAAAYNHAQHLPYRRQMMQDWANYLDNVRTGKVLQFVKAS
ncbi:MAG TPA: integrase arm-type DNA-binding domain-containing protein [Agitococcus sp.]|nr:integrase arm-type DNA-binding domain-containing protein [Agitococcus sp.]